MILREFLQRHIPGNMPIKVIWPDGNRAATGTKIDFAVENKLLKSYVFDFQITDGTPGYYCLIWVTSDKEGLIFDLN